ERQQLIKATGVEEVSTGVFAAAYEFSHSIYREAIYRALSDAARSRLHRRIAERLLDSDRREGAAERARQFEYGHDYARAGEFLLKAADAAGSRFAYRESIRMLQHALELVPAVPTNDQPGLECRIHEVIGDAHYALGAMAESARSYQSAASRAAIS